MLSKCAHELQCSVSIVLVEIKKLRSQLPVSRYSVATDFKLHGLVRCDLHKDSNLLFEVCLLAGR